MKPQTPQTRLTTQKAILETEIAQFSSFFTAEELHHKIKKEFPHLGIATIYRYLKTLVHQNQIHSYQCERRTIYSTNTKNHSHFLCEKCNTKSHLHLKNIDSLKQNLRGKMCHFQIDITGICEDCLGK